MRSEEIRTYELVTPEELRRARSRNLKHPDLYRAIQALKGMDTGEGLKLKCPGDRKEARKRRKAAAQIARREKVGIRTMLRGEWLFIEKVKKE